MGKRVGLETGSKTDSDERGEVLDVAYMMRLRRRSASLFEPSAVGLDGDFARPGLYVLVDSSPHENMNWLMGEYQLVSGAHLPRVCASFWRLCALGKFSPEDDFDELRIEEEREAVYFVRDSVQRHTLPPVGLGSARSSLLHEAHAFYHSMYLETGSAGLLATMVRCVTSISTDKALPTSRQILHALLRHVAMRMDGVHISQRLHMARFSAWSSVSCTQSCVASHVHNACVHSYVQITGLLSHSSLLPGR